MHVESQEIKVWREDPSHLPGAVENYNKRKFNSIGNLDYLRPNHGPECQEILHPRDHSVQRLGPRPALEYAHVLSLLEVELVSWVLSPPTKS